VSALQTIPSSDQSIAVGRHIAGFNVVDQPDVNGMDANIDQTVRQVIVGELHCLEDALSEAGFVGFPYDGLGRVKKEHIDHRRPRQRICRSQFRGSGVQSRRSRSRRRSGSRRQEARVRPAESWWACVEFPDLVPPRVIGRPCLNLSDAGDGGRAQNGEQPEFHDRFHKAFIVNEMGRRRSGGRLQDDRESNRIAHPTSRRTLMSR